MDSSDLAFKLADRYWNLSNTVTGVVLAQMLFFLYSLGQNERFQSSVRREWRIVYRAIWISGVAYSTVLAVLLGLEISALRVGEGLGQAIPHARWTGYFRLAIVWGVTIAGVLMLRRDRRKYRHEYPSAR